MTHAALCADTELDTGIYEVCPQRREFQRDKLSMAALHALVTDVEKRLKCSSCDAKNGKLLFGSYVGD